MTRSAFDKTGLGEAKAHLDQRGYDRLRDYLKKQKLPELVLSFEQIEEIIDAALPRATAGGRQERAVQADEVRVEPRSIDVLAPAKAGAQAA